MDKKLFTKNFTLLVLGQVSSLFGNFILKFALSMYVLEATGSAAVFAGVLAAAAIPTILLSPFGGILADRANRRNIMVALDLLSGSCVLCALLLLMAGGSIPVIAVLLILLSILGAFESPAVQASVPQMQTGDNIIRGNAAVAQVASAAALIAPILGGVLYAAFGLKTAMAASVLCFFLTAAFECFIKLEYTPYDGRKGVIEIIKNDFSVSMRFMCREQPGILKILLLAALINFFVMGIFLVGSPFIIRTVLGLNAKYYGVAQSILGLSAIFGSVAAGMLTGKLKMRKLFIPIVAAGVFLIPVGAAFLLPAGVFTRYALNIAAICGMQLSACIFSVFELSYIQQKTPDHLIGKVMAYVVTISLCIQPLGQVVYGLLFDQFQNVVSYVLISTGVILCLIGWWAAGFFRRLEAESLI